MADIRVENLRKEFNNGEVVAVRDLDITFPSGTTTCLLGPSGCGKTTLMRIIAGLEAPTTGDIYFDNERITNLSTRRRNIGMVFQYPVAYRGSTVRRNMELPLIAEKLAKPERDRRIAEVAELLEMTDALDRDVDTLDNGTRQKVAVARAVARFPKIILFDEPITNIDINAKLQLKRALKELITRLDQTIIYVTHDQTEAMTLADRIALMKDGSIVQYDEPRTLYNQPNDVFGGWFLGNPGMNFVEHRFDDAADTSLFDRPVTLQGAGAAAREITLGIRPEHVQVSNEPLPGGVRGRVVDRAIVIGGQYLVTLDVAGKRLKAKVAAHLGAGLQDEVWVALPPERITLFDQDGQKPDATLQFA